MRKIKKGDNVVVIAGRDKGKRGDVARIVDARHVVVNGVNTVKKHAKPNPLKNLCHVGHFAFVSAAAISTQVGARQV